MSSHPFIAALYYHILVVERVGYGYLDMIQDRMWTMYCVKWDWHDTNELAATHACPCNIHLHHLL